MLSWEGMSDQYALDDKQIAKIRKIFDKYDKDGSGKMDKSEFRALNLKLGESLTDQEELDAFNSIDVDNSSRIDWKEFIKWYNQ